MALALSVTRPATCSEQELVGAVRDGDDRAFGELFSRYRDRICAYVFGMVGDHGRAEDIVQEVFISALRRLRETDRPIAFRQWIYEIARNASIDEFRRSRRTHEVPLERDEEFAVCQRAVSSLATPDAAVESKQRIEDLRGAFGGLSDTHHRILVLRELEGLSYSEIGERLGMSRPIVESTLFRARRRLGEEYQELLSGRRCQQVHAVIEADAAGSLRSLGLRQRRRLARHLAHCQPCRRQARMAGIDEGLFRTPGTLGKIAAWLPIPWLRWRRASADEEALAGTGSHTLAFTQSLQSVARFADPGGPTVGLGRAAAAATAIVIAGAGGGLVTRLHPPARGDTPGPSIIAASAPAASRSSVPWSPPIGVLGPSIGNAPALHGRVSLLRSFSPTGASLALPAVPGATRLSTSALLGFPISASAAPPAVPKASGAPAAAGTGTSTAGSSGPVAGTGVANGNTAAGLDSGSTGTTISDQGSATESAVKASGTSIVPEATQGLPQELTSAAALAQLNQAVGQLSSGPAGGTEDESQQSVTSDGGLQKLDATVVGSSSQGQLQAGQQARYTPATDSDADGAGQRSQREAGSTSSGWQPARALLTHSGQPSAAGASPEFPVLDPNGDSSSPAGEAAGGHQVPGPKSVPLQSGSGETARDTVSDAAAQNLLSEVGAHAEGTETATS